MFFGCGIIMLFFNTCQQEKTYEITNQRNEDIIDLPIVINRTVVKSYLKDTGTYSQVVVRDEAGKLLASQCDDIDGDGRWDEMAFLCDLKAGETKKIVFVNVKVEPDYPVRTNIRFGRMTKPYAEVRSDLRMKTNDTRYSAPVYQMEGPAWENDLIAFRNYYDARNGIDIFGKRTTSMVLDSVGVSGRDYHTLADWGMDILKVGNSLGAGAIALCIGDSLYRVGPCEEGHYRFICEGVVRAIFELKYKNVPAAGRFYNITHQISIYAGERFYRSRIWVNNLRGDEELVTGIVNLHDVSAETFSEGTAKGIFSLGNQGISGEVLGMGIILPAREFIKFWEAPIAGSGIVNTHLVSLTLKKDVSTEYLFLAVWELQDQHVREKPYFIDLLKSAAKKLE